MNLRALRSFVTVVEFRTFAAAAEALSLSQSAISLQIRGLEAELGIRIFDRNRRPPALTSQGLALLPRARELLAQADILVREFREPEAPSLVSIGAVPTSVTGILPATLAALKESRPKLHIRVITGLSHELARRVVKGELDMALISEPENLPPRLRWRLVSPEPLVIIAPHDVCKSDPRIWLRQRPFLRFQRYAWASQLIEGELRRRDIRVKVAMELDSLEGIALMVACGLGVSVVPQRHIPHPFPDGVRTAPFGIPQAHRNLGVVDHPHQSRSPLVDSVYEALLGVVSRHKRAAPQ